MAMIIRLLLLIFGSFMIAACGHSGRSPINVDELLDTEWVLVEIDGRTAADRVTSTIRFQSNDWIVGWGGCNRYFAGVRSDGDGISIGPIGSTRKICPPLEMNQEDQFFRALEKARKIRMQDSYLVIDCQGNKKSLKFINRKR
jgi:heat shock protein HslJ